MLIFVSVYIVNPPPPCVCVCVCVCVQYAFHFVFCLFDFIVLFEKCKIEETKIVVYFWPNKCSPGEHKRL